MIFLSIKSHVCFMYCINRNRNMHKRILYMHCSETATVIYLFIRKDLKKRKIGHDRVRARHSLYWEVIISCQWQIWFYDFSNLQWCNGCHVQAWGAWMTCRFMSCSGQTWKLVKLILADFPPNVKYKTISCQDKTVDIHSKISFWLWSCFVNKLI